MLFEGTPLDYSFRAMKAYRSRVQMVLQDAAGSLNPRQTVYESVAEGIRLHDRARSDEQGRTETELVAAALSEAGLRPPERLFLRYPHELSGGQKQRVLIAGALALRPELVIADEPVSSLDASIRGEILALLLKLRQDLGMGVVVVTHDLGLAWNIADRIAVMYLGRVVECGTTEEVLTAPQAPLHEGTAVRGPRDRVPRAGGPHRRGARPEPDPERVPVPPPLPRAGGRQRRSGPASPRPAAPSRWRSSRPPASTGRPATSTACSRQRSPWGDTLALLTRESVVSARGGTVTDGELQAALPREMYVDPGQWTVERDAVLYGEWYCVGRLDDLGLASPKRVVAVDVAGESVLVTSDEDGTLHAAYNVCRHRGSQLCSPEQPARDAASLRCPYHSWTYALDGSLLKAPHATVDDPAAFALHPVGVETWQGFVFVHLTPATAAAALGAGGARRRDAGQLRASATWSPVGCCATRSRPTTRCSSRTTTSATTAARCTRSCRGWCRRSPVAGPASTGTAGSRTARARGRSP